ncbi:UNVERIFIED_CONTAM: hypothetical protein H355_013778 [Colinus virginianus]|nr:hypothetical protein H355_013778 [Colinus virginianus]
MPPHRSLLQVLPEELLRKLEKKDLPFERYYDLTAAEIGELVRVPQMGKLLHRLIHLFPKLELAAFVQPLTRTCLLVELTLTPDFQWDSKIHGNGELFWIIVEDVDGEMILHHEVCLSHLPVFTSVSCRPPSSASRHSLSRRIGRSTHNGVQEEKVQVYVHLVHHRLTLQIFILPPFTGEVEHTLCFTLPITDPLPPNYHIRVVSDRWLHAQASLPISFKNLILPDRAPPHTELLDLQPLPVTAFRDSKFEKLYMPSFKTFNPIQTQTEPPAQWKAVYIAPHPAVVKERYEEWKEKLGKGLGVKVAELTGEMQPDIKVYVHQKMDQCSVIVESRVSCICRDGICTPEKAVTVCTVGACGEFHKCQSALLHALFPSAQILEQSHLVLTTPEKWDFISRRWKTRKVLQATRLLLVDDLHVLNSSVGSTLEVWLFNFHPSVRTVPLEISLHGFDVYNREARLLAMSRAVYQAIKLYTGPSAGDEEGSSRSSGRSSSSRRVKNVIVFCSDRRHCRLTAVDLLLQAAAEDEPKRFLHVSGRKKKKKGKRGREGSGSSVIDAREQQQQQQLCCYTKHGRGDK